MLSSSCSFSYFCFETKGRSFSFWSNSKNKSKSKSDEIPIWKNQMHAGLHQVAKRISLSAKN